METRIIYVDEDIYTKVMILLDDYEETIEFLDGEAHYGDAWVEVRGTEVDLDKFEDAIYELD